MVRFKFNKGDLQLDDITSLSYWEYVTTRKNDLDIFIDIWLDFDGDGVATTDDYPAYMQAEPLYTVGTVPLNTWRKIDVMILKWQTYVGLDDPYNGPTLAQFIDNTVSTDYTESVDFGALDYYALIFA